ncbi:MAG: hypothetical protein HZB76_00160 [Chlamydiae bacterium]|nr:hypothetical protein [Chlamydiota bacterium]
MTLIHPVILFNPYNPGMDQVMTIDSNIVDIYQKILEYSALNKLSETEIAVLHFLGEIQQGSIKPSCQIVRIFNDIFQRLFQKNSSPILDPITLINPLNPREPTSLITSNPILQNIYFRLLQAANASSYNFYSFKELKEIEKKLNGFSIEPGKEQAQMNFLKRLLQKLMKIQLDQLLTSYSDNLDFEMFKKDFQQNLENNFNEEPWSFIFSQSQRTYDNLKGRYPTIFDDKRQLMVFFAIVLKTTKLCTDKHIQNIKFAECLPYLQFQSKYDYANQIAHVCKKLNAAEWIVLEFLEFKQMLLSEINNLNPYLDYETERKLIEFENISNLIISSSLPANHKLEALDLLYERILQLPITNEEQEENIRRLLKKVKNGYSAMKLELVALDSIKNEIQKLFFQLDLYLQSSDETIDTLSEFERIANLIITTPLAYNEKEENLSVLFNKISYFQSTHTKLQKEINLLIQKIQKEVLMNLLDYLKIDFLKFKIKETLANIFINDDDKYFSLYCLNNKVDETIQKVLNLHQALGEENTPKLNFEFVVFVYQAQQFQEIVKKTQLELWPTSYY